MTTFHEQPPRSRRAARQSERNQAPEEQSAVEGFTTFPTQEDSKQATEDSQSTSDAEATHAATPSAAAAAAATQAMPPAPATSQPSTDAAYRAAPPPTPQSQNPALPPPVEATTPPRDARTLTRRELRELRAREEADLATDAGSPESGPDNDHAQGSTPQPVAAVPEVPAYVEPPALVDPLSVVPEAASPQTVPEDALSAFESLLANADGSAKDAGLSDAPRSPLVDPNDWTAAAPPVAKSRAEHNAAPAAPQPQPDAQSTIHDLFGLDTDAGAKDDVPAAPPVATNLSNARAEFDELARKRLDADVPAVAPKPALILGTESLQAALNLEPAPVSPVGVSPASVAIAPAGAWSRQAPVADDVASDAVVARTIGSGSSITSALVLPAIPFATDIRGPLNSRGEAVLTGSIDLPSTLSASGVSDRFDHADIDSLLDLNDSDIVSTDSAPVRAVKAVSTFSNQSVTQTQKPKGTRALTVLLISASSMAVVVAGLLVAAFAFNML